MYWELQTLALFPNQFILYTHLMSLFSTTVKLWWRGKKDTRESKLFCAYLNRKETMLAIFARSPTLISIPDVWILWKQNVQTITNNSKLCINKNLFVCVYIYIHTKINLGNLSFAAYTANILACKCQYPNLPDTVQRYLHLGSYGSNVELFVHTVKKVWKHS